VKDSVILPEIINFEVDAGNDTTVYEGATFNLNGKTNSTLARWSPFEFISDSTSLTPLFTAKKTINYALTGIKDGCRINDIIQIRVIQLQNIPPNSFSPNGDKINDVWEIPFLDDFPNCHVQVFTRWGQTVFETTGYSFFKSWDGTYNGNLIDAGTYYYVIELHDPKINDLVKGSLTIVR
jgi:gliding motility-associated-like protein